MIFEYVLETFPIDREKAYAAHVDIPSMAAKEEFETKYMTYFIDKTATKFDNTPIQDVRLQTKTFAELPSSNQSVLVSVIWQYGVNTNTLWINEVFSAGRIDNWQKVKEILLQQKDYTDRRKAEANTIQVSPKNKSI